MPPSAPRALSWWARYQATAQNAALRDQWLRERRRDTCVQLLSAAWEFQTAVIRYRRQVEEGDGDRAAMRVEAYRAYTATQPIVTTVRIEGPSDIEQLCDHLNDFGLGLPLFAESQDVEAWEEANTKYRDHLLSIAAAAQKNFTK